MPSSWKRAALRLLPKGSAQDNPASPSNFRLVALTPTVSKLLSEILRDRWLRYMWDNNYLDPNIRKAFLPTVPGVSEHQAKLAAIFKSAKRMKRSLAVAWLDIANAYGSVHHALIQFSVAHYHAPPEFCILLQSWYSGLLATVSIEGWVTPPLPLEIGVYQGVPLSVVIFLTVMNTLSHTLKTRGDLGYTIPSSTTPTNHLLYADDICIISNSPAGCQHLLSMVERWLQWSLLKAKVPKCCTMCFQASTGRKIDPGLSLNGEMIPATGDDGFKFLGMLVRVHNYNNDARTSLLKNLKRMLEVVDRSPVTCHQKIRLYKLGICPRLSWTLMVEEFPLTWLERCLQPLAIRFLKKWVGLAQPSNTAILFLPKRTGGLALPSLVSLYKKQQSSRMVQLFTSDDPGVRRAAHLLLQEEERAQ